MRSIIKFLTSVKLALVLIILVTLAAVVGTLIPQERAAQDYVARYGQAAGPMMKLQLTRVYHSYWFKGLLLFLALNIVVCSLERLPAKWRKAVKAGPDFDPKGLLALKVSDKFRRPGPLAPSLEAARRALADFGYKVREEGSGPERRLRARKRSLGWFGSDIVHLGLIVILAGGILSGLASRRQYLNLYEGRSANPPGGAFAVRLDKFETEMYPQGGVKAWKSTVTVIENGRDVLTRVIAVNHPLSYRGINLYQSSYGWDWMRPSLELWIKKKSDPAFLEKRRLCPGEAADFGPGLKVSLARFVPDFVMSQDGTVETRSDQPGNPAALIEIQKGQETLSKSWVFANYPDFAGTHSGPAANYAIELKNIDAPQISVLEAASDPGVGIIWAGCVLLMAGLFLAFYWPPREIRLALQESQGKTEVVAGGIASKAREAFEAEFGRLVESLRRNR